MSAMVEPGPERVDEPASPSGRWRRPSLALIWGLLPLALGAARVGLLPTRPHDYWWALAFGRAVEQVGVLHLHQNLFLYTMPASAPFINQPWLSQWLMYRLVQWGGHDAPVWAHGVLLVSALAALMALGRARGASWRALGGVTSLALVALSANLIVRTRIFVYPCFAATLWALWAWRTAQSTRGRLGAALALMGVGALWSNLHGSFILVMALVGAQGVGQLAQTAWSERRPCLPTARRWALLLAATIGACCLNPLGPSVYGYALGLMFGSTVGQTVSEWQPYALRSPEGALYYALATCAVGVMVWRRRALQVGDWLMAGGLLFMGLRSQRAALWWPLLAPVIVAPALRVDQASAPAPAPVSAGQGALHWGLALGMVWAALSSWPGGRLFDRVELSLRPQTRRHAAPGLRALSVETPARVLAELAQRGYPGNLYHDQSLGGALEYALSAKGPAQVAFVDQRMELVPEAVWEDYFTLERVEDGLDAALERWGIRAALLYRPTQRALERALLARGWRLVAHEIDHVLLLRQSHGAWPKDEPLRWEPSPEPPQ